MSDVLRALGISAGILLLVVVLIVVISMVAVKRGEASQHGIGHGAPEPLPGAKETAVTAAAKPTKAGAPETEEISVANILLLGLGLFVLTVLFLVGLSLIQHSM